MKLQLADGYIEKPIGLLEKVVVSSCGVEYEHTFAVVDFGKNPNYDIILGRPFMRQLKMIQDWGFNFIYLRQPQAITRINLGNHTYRDVAKTPVEDFDQPRQQKDLLDLLGYNQILIFGCVGHLKRDQTRKVHCPRLMKITYRNHSLTNKSYRMHGTKF